MRRARPVIAVWSIAVVLAGSLKAADSDKAAESSYKEIVGRKRAEALCRPLRTLWLGRGGGRGTRRIPLPGVDCILAAPSTGAGKNIEIPNPNKGSIIP